MKHIKKFNEAFDAGMKESKLDKAFAAKGWSKGWSKDGKLYRKGEMTIKITSDGDGVLTYFNKDGVKSTLTHFNPYKLIPAADRYAELYPQKATE